MESFISYNGLNFTNIKNREVSYLDNVLRDSKWVLSITGAKMHTSSVFKKYAAAKKCDALIATASPTLKVPFEDYQEIQMKLLGSEGKLHPQSDQVLRSMHTCKELRLPILFLEFSTFKLQIPPFSYTKDLKNDKNGFRCEILIR